VARFRAKRNCTEKVQRAAAVCILLLTAGTVTSLARTRNTEKLPAASQVLERYVEVTGGRKALLMHKSMTLHGRYQVPARKLDLETVAYMKGGKAVWKFVLPNNKEYVSGCDGKTAWDLDPSGKATAHKGDAAKSGARDADMYYHLHVMNYFRSMDVVGVKEFKGRACYHLRGVNNWGQVNEHFYDKETGLLVGYAYSTAWRGGKGETTVTFEDYKNFDGVLMPTRTTTRDGNDLTISLTTTVTYDDVYDSVFVLPETVRKAAARPRATP
jgi:hypothetical protein